MQVFRVTNTEYRRRRRQQNVANSQVRNLSIIIIFAGSVFMNKNNRT